VGGPQWAAAAARGGREVACTRTKKNCGALCIATAVARGCCAVRCVARRQRRRLLVQGCGRAVRFKSARASRELVRTRVTPHASHVARPYRRSRQSLKMSQRKLLVAVDASAEVRSALGTGDPSRRGPAPQRPSACPSDQGSPVAAPWHTTASRYTAAPAPAAAPPPPPPQRTPFASCPSRSRSLPR
jgi:hypothetical protein